ncbi:hypothetical protein ACRRTK_009538 [Alexandromys fortis]
MQDLTSQEQEWVEKIGERPVSTLPVEEFHYCESSGSVSEEVARRVFRGAETRLPEQGGGSYCFQLQEGPPRSPRLSSGPWCSRDFRRSPGERRLRRARQGACRLAGEDAARTCEHPELLPLRQPQPQRDPRTRCQRLLNFPL